MPVALEHRLVEALLVAEDLPLLRARLAAEHACGDIAWEHLREDEDERADRQQCDERESETRDDELADHGAREAAARAARRGPGSGWCGNELRATCSSPF
jgi:hypothetical protein